MRAFGHVAYVRHCVSACADIDVRDGTLVFGCSLGWSMLNTWIIGVSIEAEASLLVVLTQRWGLASVYTPC